MIAVNCGRIAFQNSGTFALDIVELGMAFEDKFGVSIPDEDYEKLRTVKDAVHYIETHK